MKAARETVGEEIELMVDAGGSDAFWPHGYKWAWNTSKMLADYDVTWFEEPLRPDDLDGYIRLTETAPLPIAACEVFTRRQSFLPWIERRAVDYVQPDVTKVGGISEEHRIAQYADDHSILFVPHGWNTAVGLAADLQLVAAAGNAQWVEYLTPAPYIEELLLEPIELTEEGMIRDSRWARTRDANGIPMASPSLPEACNSLLRRFDVTWIDWLIVLVLNGSVMCYGLLLARGAKTSEDWFLGRRSLDLVGDRVIDVRDQRR